MIRFVVGPLAVAFLAGALPAFAQGDAPSTTSAASEPAPAQPAPAQPAPAETAPAQPAPAEAVPTETVPAESAPTEAAPTETAPTETAPTEPAAAVPDTELPPPPLSPATPPSSDIGDDGAPSARGQQAAFVVAGSAAAGFVASGLLVVPVLLSLTDSAGPLVALPIGAAIAFAGTGLGAFVGEIAFAPVAPSLGVAGMSGAGALVGAGAGAAAGGFIGYGVGLGVAAQQPGGFRDIVGILVGGFLGGVGGGIAGSAGAGALGALWLTPE